jgi:hypothetical protein
MHSREKTELRKQEFGVGYENLRPWALFVMVFVGMEAIPRKSEGAWRTGVNL